ncbi:hypothetical protein HAX54_041899, partial [Datura stramonium]|nr:hypothetical protein [Datura stramonium]
MKILILGSGLRVGLGATDYGGPLQRWDFHYSEIVVTWVRCSIKVTAAEDDENKK